MQHPTDPRPLAPWDDAYRHWARHLARRGPSSADPVLVQPALVRLRRDGAGFGVARAAVLAALDAGALILSDPEGAIPEDDEPFVLSWPGDDPGAVAERFGAALEVVQVCTPVSCPEGAPVPAARPGQGWGDARPVVAVIDDGIAFLNARFCRAGPAGLRTRLAAVWVQAFRAAGPGALALGGRVIEAAEIDAHLAQGDRLDEGAVYRALNAGLFGPGAHRGTEMAASHGTMMLDLAAGGDPAGGPLLAVQLPPEAVDDTGGTALEPLIVLALRWVLDRAEAMGGTGAVIVNLSFATFAGPKDGTKPAEALMARMLERWQARTGRVARLVMAFGNGRTAELCARLTLAPGQARAIGWRLPPDDHTASFLELRPDDPARMADLGVALAPPGGDAQVLGPLPPDHWCPVIDRGAEVGRLYHIGARPSAPGLATPAHGVLAMAATVEDGARPVAGVGLWRLVLTNLGATPLTLRVEVQRGDTPGGYRPSGRQTRLEDAGAITTAGAHSSLVTARSPCVWPVAAARADGRPADWSGEGAAWTVPGPALAAVADRGGIAPGVPAAGTISGSVGAVGGTSAAAALVTRALARHLARGGVAEPAALVAALGVAAAPEDAARLGAGVIGQEG
ncbi:MAG TPA: hypothetical protein VLA78_01895 [Paracoccaceae bacterium]|nr:hypothetical protein [Paracoccaceae bacterium]